MAVINKKDIIIPEKHDFDNKIHGESSIEDAVEEFLHDNNYTIHNYIKGVCKEYSTKKFKSIDITLNLLKNKLNQREVDALITAYRNDPIRKAALIEEQKKKNNTPKEKPKETSKTIPNETLPKNEPESILKKHVNIEDDDEDDIYTLIDDLLLDNQYFIVNYKKGTCMKYKDPHQYKIKDVLLYIPGGIKLLNRFVEDPRRTDVKEKTVVKDKHAIKNEISKFLLNKGYYISDYEAGVCKKLKEEQRYDLEWLLNKLNRTDLVEKYQNDPERDSDVYYNNYMDEYDSHYNYGNYFDDDDDDEQGKIEKEIETFLKDNNFYIIDYKQGTCRSYGAEYQSRIEYVLSGLKRKDLLQKYLTDPDKKKIITKFKNLDKKPKKMHVMPDKIPPRPKTTYIGPEKQLPETALGLKKMLEKINLYKIVEKIYAVKIADVNLRGHLFLRFQEYYENGSNLFKGKQFEVEDFINWYKEFNDDEEFTYAWDWQGYNIPSEAIEECRATIKDTNNYDKIMFSIMETIRKEVGDGKFYLIGTDLGSDSLLEHEIAHGMFYVYPNYKEKMMKLIKALPSNVYQRASESLLRTGCYHQDVVDDEIHAYSSTGYWGVAGMDRYQKAFIDLFDEYYEKIKKDYKSIKIPIDYSEYFDLKGEEVQFTEDESIEDEIKEFLEELDYILVDYKKGLCKYKTAKNTTRIGQLLSKYKEAELMKKFVSDPERRNK